MCPTCQSYLLRTQTCACTTHTICCDPVPQFPVNAHVCHDYVHNMLRGGGGRGRPRKNSPGPSAAPSGTTTASTAPATADSAPPHAEHTVHLQANTEEATLRCTWVAGRNRWRWQVARGANRWANVDAYTRHAALQEWIRRHSYLIHEQDAHDIQQLYLAAPTADDPHDDPSLPSTGPEARGSAQVESQDVFLTVDQCRSLLGLRLHCHRLPPTNCKVAFQTLCHDLLSRAPKDPRVAHIILVLPKLILTTPAAATASKQCERHIRYNIDCAWANRWQQLYQRSHECQVQHTAPEQEAITDDDPPL